jgi:hypothetical protein
MKYLRNYYVPVAVKSHDYLVGFLDSLNSLGDILSFDFTLLDSTRFNDILPDGSRRRDRTDDEIKEIISQQRESFNVKENENKDAPEESLYFSITCSCGNYYEFNHPVEIPNQNLICGICDKVLIDYHGKEEYEIEYDGDVERMSVEFELENGEDDEE